MPTIDRWRGHRFYFYSHEPNEPPHVHVDSRDRTAKFWLQPVALARNVGFRADELSALLARVREHSVAYLEAWDGHFGGER